MVNRGTSKARKDHYVKTAVQHYPVLDPVLSLWLKAMSRKHPALIFFNTKIEMAQYFLCSFVKIVNFLSGKERKKKKSSVLPTLISL